MAGFEEAGGGFTAKPTVTAKLFKHGGSQAVRLPKAFRFEGDEVSVRREGDRVILEPVDRKAPTEEELAARWAFIDANGGAEFPERDQPAADERDYGL